MNKIRSLWQNEPVLVAGVLGSALVFVVQQWEVIHNILAGWGISENWLALVLALATFVLQRSQVSPVNKT